MQKIFTGVGSRETPLLILTLMFYLSRKLASEGWGLRSGGARGADTAFYNGYMDYFNKVTDIHYLNVTVYVPDHNHKAFHLYRHHCKVLSEMDNKEEACKIAESVIPHWHNCNDYAKALHSRNAYQVLGDDLQSPSNVFICWGVIAGESIKGGTRTAFEIAKNNNIRIINLANPKHYNKVLQMLNLTETKLKQLAGIHDETT